jgi:hypothetical protein
MLCNATVACRYLLCCLPCQFPSRGLEQIILRGPKLGSVSSYRLNPHYGWKGKVQNLTKARQKRLQAVADEVGPDVLDELENAP